MRTPRSAEPGAPAWVLVADGDPIAAEEVSGLVRDVGFWAYPTGRADEALRFAEVRRLALAVVDVALLDTAGHELAVCLRILDPELPVMMTSGDSRPELEVQARQVGLIYYAHKPVDARCLESVFHKALGARRPAAASSTPAGGPGGVAAGRETLLLVEDEEGIRDLAREILEGSGYTVLEAGDPVQALRVTDGYAGAIDLLVTDVVMPHMSGRDLADRLVAKRPSLRVLYMSGYTDDAIVHHGVLDPGTAFLPKPFTPDALRRKAREVLDGGANPSAAVAPVAPGHAPGGPSRHGNGQGG